MRLTIMISNTKSKYIILIFQQFLYSFSFNISHRKRGTWANKKKLFLFRGANGWTEILLKPGSERDFRQASQAVASYIHIKL